MNKRIFTNNGYLRFKLLALLLALVLITIPNRVQSQSNFFENKALYFSSELDFGYPHLMGFDLNLNYIYNYKYAFKLGYSRFSCTPKTQPDDYNPGDMAIILFFTSPFPKDKINNYQFQFGRIINVSRKMRLNLSLGVAYSERYEAINWESDYSSSMSANYTYEHGYSYGVSYIINPKIEFPFSRIVGLSLSPKYIIDNEKTSYFSIGVGLIIGVLRK